MEEDHRIEALLVKYCNSTATADEAREVEQWIDSSDENQRIARRLYLVSLAADMQHVSTSIRTEEALQELKQRMDLKSYRSASLWTWLQRVAAMLCLPLAISVFVLLYQREGKVATVSEPLLEVRANPGTTAHLRLPDSTLVCLNSGSVLQYPVHFTGKNREVHLSGEAYFEVEKDATRRFIVATPGEAKVEVFGTRFNVEAFPDGSDIATTLVEGSVHFAYHKGGKEYAIAMNPGEKVIYTPSDHTLRIKPTDGETELAWKDGKIIFNNTPFGEAMHMLEKRFHVKFLIRNKRLNTYSFTGTFTNQRLDHILEYFKLSSGIRWRYIDNADIRQERTQIELY